MVMLRIRCPDLRFVTLHAMAPQSSLDHNEYDILVVDDQPMIIEAVRRLLAQEVGVRVHGCARATEAMHAALTVRPAVILQDLTMPDGNGLDLVSAYRSARELDDVSVVVLSATEDAKVKAEAFARGASDYIEKLPPPAEFVARVRHHALASRALAARNEAMRVLEEKDLELQRRNVLLDEANDRLKSLNHDLVIDIGTQRQKVDALSAVGDGLASIQDLDVLLGTILDEAAHFSGATDGAIFLVEKSELRAATIYRNGKSITASQHLPRCTIGDDTTIGIVAASHATMRITLVNATNAPKRLAPLGILPAQPSSLMILPIMSDAQIMGVIALCDARDDDGFSIDEERFLKQFARLAAIAIERAQAARTLIFRMVAMAALRDPSETAGHVQRVAGIAEILFDQWTMRHNIDPAERAHQRDLLRIAALLHDVGKVGIADAILKKPGKLDQQERSEMERHTTIGGELFDGIRSDFDASASQVALCHHEKWDGTGYPHGIRAEAIPLSARIVAIADVYDALCSPRSYKQPWARDRVLTLFAEESGKHFDPELTEIFLSKIDDIERVRDTFLEQPSAPH